MQPTTGIPIPTYRHVILIPLSPSLALFTTASILKKISPQFHSAVVFTWSASPEPHYDNESRREGSATMRILRLIWSYSVSNLLDGYLLL